MKYASHSSFSIYDFSSVYFRYLSPPKPLSTPDGRSALASLSNSTVQARLDALRKGMKPAEASDAAPEKAKVTSFFGKIGKAAVGKFW